MAGEMADSIFWWILYVITILFVTLITLYYRVTKSSLYQMTSKVPCYKGWPVVGDLLHLPTDPNEYYHHTLKICEPYRRTGMMRLSFSVWHDILLLNASEAEKLLSSTTNLDKTRDYRMVEDWLGLGLLTSSKAKWKTRRRLLTPSFHFNILKDFLHIMNEQVEDFISLLCDYADTDKEFDIASLITLQSLNVIGETAMGVQFDALKERNSLYVEAVMAAKDALFYRFRCPWLWSNVLFYLSPTGKRFFKAVKYLHQFTYNVIKQRRESRHQGSTESKYKAFLDTLLDCQDESGQFLTDDDIREEVDTFMFEGHDTVSSGISYAIYLLGCHPDEQLKCQQELDEIFESPRPITWDDLSKMTYLEWCIKEALRLYPSVPWYGRTLAHDTEFGEVTVPKGATVFVFSSFIHRDPHYYPDPEKFNPIRFSPENSSSRHPYAYVPFSAGSRNCIGQRFAMMELKVMLASVLRKFNIVSTQRKEELRDNPGLVLEPSNGIKIKLTNRH